MGDVERQIRDLGRVRTGEILEVWHHGVLRHRGQMEGFLPRLGVVVIRETGNGERKMIFVEDHDFVYG